jgi:hypothetical protein
MNVDALTLAIIPRLIKRKVVVHLAAIDLMTHILWPSVSLLYAVCGKI